MAAREWLGPGAVRFRFTHGGAERDGWRAPARGRDEAWAAQATRALRAEGDDVRLYLGDGGRTAFALPGVSPLEVIEIARVGAHDGVDPRDVRAVLEAAALPFDVTFADEAGLEAVFREPIDVVRARALAEAVLDRDWIDSICLMGEEGGELLEGAANDERDGLATVVAYIVARNALRLWWD